MPGFASALANITDPYDRQARLWPALLALMPLFITLGAIYGPRLSAFGNAISVAIACGSLYLAVQISRARGKVLEEELFATWGGKPSTQLLRHSNSTIEAPTKSRYHAFLSRKLGQPFPNASQEASERSAADEFYQSAVRWLLNQTSDRERFALLFKENISYGFRRNALGLKPFAIALAIACVLFVLVNYGVVTAAGWSNKSLAMLPDEAWLSLVTSIIAVGVWLTFFTKKAVKTAAFTYAETLLRACDVLD